MITIITLIVLIIPYNVEAESANFSVLNYDLELNSEFIVKINIQDLVEAGTVEFSLVYDPNLISYLDAVSGDVMAPDLGLLDAINKYGELERLSIAIATLSPSVSGSGELANLRFKSNSNIGSGEIIMQSMLIYSVDFMIPPIDATTSNNIVFNISLPSGGESISEIAESWEHGSLDTNSSNYWNLQAVNSKTEFLAGESVCVLSKIDNHRWRNEFYREGQLIWVDESPWLDVGSGWSYANSMPIFYNLQVGLGEVKVWLDTGMGYSLMSEIYYNVTSDKIVNEYLGANLCESWMHGPAEEGTPEYWNLQCIKPSLIFNEGERVYLLAQIANISDAHEWKLEVYHDNLFEWDYNPGLQNTDNNLWAYSNFSPYINNVKTGSYDLKIFFKTDNDFALVDSKQFTVKSIYNNTIPYSVDFNNNVHGFVQEDSSSLQDGEMRLATIDGRECLEFEKIGPTGIYWYIQTKKLGLEFEDNTSYNASVWLRAETPGMIWASIQKETSPWGNLGLSKTLEITDVWREYDLDFTFTGDINPSDTRFSIMYGNHDGKIWMDDLSFSKK